MVYFNGIRSIAIGSFDGIHLDTKIIDMAEAVVVIEKNRANITHGIEEETIF